LIKPFEIIQENTKYKMKLKLTLLAFATTMGLASAYTITVTNQSTFGDPSLPVVDNTGAPIATGFVGVGFFASDSAVTDNARDFTALLSGFNQYGSPAGLAGAGAAPGLFDLVSPANWTVAVPFTSTAPQIGKNIYVVFGNGASLAESEQLGIWKSNNVFGKEDEAGNGGTFADIATGQGALLLGLSGGAQSFGGGAINYSDSIRLVAADGIPEPSTGLLAGLAGLALVARRRR